MSEKAWSRFVFECATTMWFILLNVHVFEGRPMSDSPMLCRALKWMLLYIGCITCLIPLLLLSMLLLCFCYSAESLCSSNPEVYHHHHHHHHHHHQEDEDEEEEDEEEGFGGGGGEEGRDEKQGSYGANPCHHDHTITSVFSHSHAHSYHSATTCKSPNDTMCCICLDEYSEDDQLRQLHCGHKFHRRCVGEWLRRSSTCPVCIRRVTAGGRPSRPPCREFSDDLLLCFL